MITANNLAGKKNVLLRFNHGLGDHVQFRCVLSHLRYYYPDCEFSVMSSLGTGDLYADLVKEWFSSRKTDYSMRWIDNLKYDRCLYIQFGHPEYDWDGVCTKVPQCLLAEFGLATIADLCTYDCTYQEEQAKRVDDWYASLPPNEGAFLIHYEGASGGPEKDLNPYDVADFCRELSKRNLVPVLLDWSPNGNAIVQAGLAVSPNAIWEHRDYAEAGELYCLIERATGTLAIDSGIGHVAGCCTSPVFIVWTKHFPLYCYDLDPAGNVLHLLPDPLPDEYAELKGCSEVWDAFEGLYNYASYSAFNSRDPFNYVLKWLDQK